MYQGRFFAWRGGIGVEMWESRSPQGFLRVRRDVWLLLAGALLLAALLPVVGLWHASSSELAVRGCLWPAQPRVGEQTQLYIVLDNMNDRAAVDGPWSHVAATWDMADMRMGERTVQMSGEHSGSGRFALPLRLDMAGRWLVHASLEAPGRPMWQATYHIDVDSSPVTNVSPRPTSVAAHDPSVDPCGPGGGGRLL